MLITALVATPSAATTARVMTRERMTRERWVARRCPARARSFARSSSSGVASGRSAARRSRTSSKSIEGLLRGWDGYTPDTREPQRSLPEPQKLFQASGPGAERNGPRDRSTLDLLAAAGRCRRLDDPAIRRARRAVQRLRGAVVVARRAAGHREHARG